MITRLTAFLLAVAASLPAHAASLRQQQTEDLEWAASHYVQESKAFTPETRRAALDYIATARKRAGSYSPQQFMALLMRIPAFAGNGHDYFDPGKGYFPDTRLPFRTAWFGDAMVVSRAPEQYRNLLGARVERVAGHSPEQLNRRLGDYFGGIAHYTRWNANWAYEAGGMLHAMGIAPKPDKLRMRFRLADGKVQELDVPFVPASSVPFVFGHVPQLSALPAEAEAAKGWRSAVNAPGEPFYLQEPEQPFRMRDLAGGEVLYLQLRTHVETPDGKLAAFTERAEQRLRAAMPRYVVVDLRLDSGGNSDITRELATTIGERAGAGVYILTGPRTFSAGIVTAAAIKRDARVPVKIVGEAVGDPLRWWSEGRDTCLPHSGYCMHITTGLWDLEKGCAGEDACYGDKLKANVGSLAPDMPAPLTSTAWLQGRDPAMEAVLADIQAAAPLK